MGYKVAWSIETQQSEILGQSRKRILHFLISSPSPPSCRLPKSNWVCLGGKIGDKYSLPGNATIASSELCNCLIVFLSRQHYYRLYTIYTIASNILFLPLTPPPSMSLQILQCKTAAYLSPISIPSIPFRACYICLQLLLFFQCTITITITSSELCHCKTPASPLCNASIAFLT